jgi:uracil-DNA glycosylase family 4
MNKEKKFDALINNMGKCKKCLELKNKNGKDYSLINIYKDNEFAKNIPSIWTDWYNRLDSDIMIIGQDWGPFVDMKQLNEEYLQKENKDNWLQLIEKEKSSTKKLLTKYIVESSKGKISNLDEIYITNAIMCARKGTQYRKNNIDLKKSTFHCEEYLKKQIEIVKPKIILTLGYYPLKSLSDIYGFEIEDTLKSTIQNTPIIRKEKFIIVPLYHPVAQIKKQEQLEQYNRIWEYL